MARQRFIWPSLWNDKRFGALKNDERVLFIALFSLADDEGRIAADPVLLKANVFPFDNLSEKKVRAIRDSVCDQMPHVRLYKANGEDFISLCKWGDYQKPKYPKPSKIPPPFPERSGNASGSMEEASPMGWVGLGRDGLGGAVEPSTTEREPGEQPPAGFKIPDKALTVVEGGAEAA